MSQSITIERRFRGPPDSANGGYICGRIAGLIGKAATVRLMAPPPLDTPLSVKQADGYTWLYHGEKPVARAQASADLDLAVPEVPPVAAVTAAQDNFRGLDEHFYPGCFVCGPDRKHGDGLRIFAGDLGEGPLVAACWTPDTASE